MHPSVRPFIRRSAFANGSAHPSYVVVDPLVRHGSRASVCGWKSTQRLKNNSKQNISKNVAGKPDENHFNVTILLKDGKGCYKMLKIAKGILGNPLCRVGPELREVGSTLLLRQDGRRICLDCSSCLAW